MLFPMPPCTPGTGLGEEKEMPMYTRKFHPSNQEWDKPRQVRTLHPTPTHCGCCGEKHPVGDRMSEYNICDSCHMVEVSLGKQFPLFFSSEDDRDLIVWCMEMYRKQDAGALLGLLEEEEEYLRSQLFPATGT